MYGLGGFLRGQHELLIQKAVKPGDPAPVGLAAWALLAGMVLGTNVDVSSPNHACLEGWNSRYLIKLADSNDPANFLRHGDGFCVHVSGSHVPEQLETLTLEQLAAAWCEIGGADDRLLWRQADERRILLKSVSTSVGLSEELVRELAIRGGRFAEGD
jgi:hypothetical protein